LIPGATLARSLVKSAMNSPTREVLSLSEENKKVQRLQLEGS
jgi:hypothetical protein